MPSMGEPITSGTAVRAVVPSPRHRDHARVAASNSGWLPGSEKLTPTDESSAEINRLAGMSLRLSGAPLTEAAAGPLWTRWRKASTGIHVPCCGPWRRRGL